MAAAWSIILALAALTAPAPQVGAELNVWLDKRSLAHVFDWMLFLTAKNPLRAKCKPSTNTAQHRALTLNEYPLISDGVLLSHPQLDALSKAGIALAHNINSLSIGWSDIDRLSGSQATYRFLRLKSHNITMLREPMLDIPVQGYVPNARSGFQVRLQCTNRISGITGFEIHVVFDWPQQPNRRLIVLQRYFKKACLSKEDLSRHQRKCHCRSLCSQLWQRRRHRPVAKQRHEVGRDRRSGQQRRRCQRRCQKQCRKTPGSCGGEQTN